MFESFLPYLLKTAAIGLIAGVIAGFLVKKVSKIAVFIIVVGFILFQVAIYNGYISIEWLSWKDTAVDVVKNTKLPSSEFKELLMSNLPLSISAILGFIIGFSKG